jgi:hypothetical protein
MKADVHWPAVFMCVSTKRPTGLVEALLVERRSVFVWRPGIRMSCRAPSKRHASSGGITSWPERPTKAMTKSHPEKSNHKGIQIATRTLKRFRSKTLSGRASHDYEQVSLTRSSNIKAISKVHSSLFNVIVHGRSRSAATESLAGNFQKVSNCEQFCVVIHYDILIGDLGPIDVSDW